MLDITSIKKDLKKSNRRTKVLNSVDHQITLDVMNGQKPVWGNNGCHVRGALVSTSYEVHRALLLLWRFNNREETNETECDPLDFNCLM